MITTVYPYRPPCGMIRLRVGDVLKRAGVNWIVDMVNECRARLLPMTMRKVELQNSRTGEKVSFERLYQRYDSISNCIEPSSVVCRLGEDGLQQFLKAKVSGPEENTKGKHQKESMSQVIAKLSASTPPRGGLAAEAAALKAAEEPQPPQAPATTPTPPDAPKEAAPQSPDTPTPSEPAKPSAGQPKGKSKGKKRVVQPSQPAKGNKPSASAKGRTEFIRECVKAGKTVEQTFELAKAKFKNTGLPRVKRIYSRIKKKAKA